MLSTRRALLFVAAFALTADAPADAARLKGRVQTGDAPAANARVTLFASGEDRATRLGTATTNRRGRFAIRYRRRAGAVHYAIARKATATQLSAISIADGAAAGTA